VILLHYVGFGGGSYHSLQVRKMRRTNHAKDIFPMEIGKNGIEIKKPES
jgi:KaiC/GvpD/RAD55 family RecA-like ATPase